MFLKVAHNLNKHLINAVFDEMFDEIRFLS